MIDDSIRRRLNFINKIHRQLNVHSVSTMTNSHKWSKYIPSMISWIFVEIISTLLVIIGIFVLFYYWYFMARISNSNHMLFIDSYLAYDTSLLPYRDNNDLTWVGIHWMFDLNIAIKSISLCWFTNDNYRKSSRTIVESNMFIFYRSLYDMYD
jgi:hypothetical protein